MGRRALQLNGPDTASSETSDKKKWANCCNIEKVRRQTARGVVHRDHGDNNRIN